MNQLVLIALRRPLTFVVMSILIVVFGGLTVLHMPTDVFPNITIPITSVVWVYNGLLPQQVEGRITYLPSHRQLSRRCPLTYRHP